jgi:hypothetical protein
MFTAQPSYALPSRVAVLAPPETPVAGRLERNVTSMSLFPVRDVVDACTRAAVTRRLDTLDADSALCTDGDSVGVWIMDSDHVVLKDVIVSTSADERGQEITAARATMVLRAGLGKKDAGPQGITIVAQGPNAGIYSTAVTPTVVRDTAPPAPPPKPMPRMAPPLVLAVGPAASASRDGTSFSITAAAEIGFSRTVALVPWINFVPANRVAETSAGSASFRPTIFGLGFSMPFTPPSSTLVPRLGAGYAMLWMHVSPETAQAPAAARKPEDLLAPALYVSGSLSLALTKSFRVAAEAMGGVASHQMIVRIANERAAYWGVPIATLGLRGEWVLQ